MLGEKDYEQMYCFFKAGQTLSFVWVCYYGQRTYSSALIWESTCIEMYPWMEMRNYVIGTLNITTWHLSISDIGCLFITTHIIVAIQMCIIVEFNLSVMICKQYYRLIIPVHENMKYFHVFICNAIETTMHKLKPRQWLFKEN